MSPLKHEVNLMSANSNSRSETPTGHQPSRGRYEIRFQGHLHARWASWFDGLTVTDESDGTTLVQGPVADQAALHGLLRKLHDLGLPLLSVTRIGPDEPEAPAHDIRYLTSTEETP